MSGLRSMCAGAVPLRGRLEPWHEELAGDPGQVSGWLDEHGSPLNLIDPGPMARNAAELSQAAADRGVPLRVFFARKANKALGLVDKASELALGVDVASDRELRQVLDRGVAPGDVIVTAAVKPRALLELCVESAVTVAIDNADELQLYRGLAGPAGRRTPIAMRLAPAASGRPPTRFGMPAAEIAELIGNGPEDALELAGIHFHLDGYDAGERVAAIAESLELIDGLHERGHEPRFLDIGGGVPMSYLESKDEWSAFWSAPATLDGHEMGGVYPYWQAPVRGTWLAGILDASLTTETVADAIRQRNLELRCEPGRSLLDGCGMTVARVEYRKRRADGEWLIGLAMNRTQMRSTSDDFMVDPLLLRPDGAGEPSAAIDGYLVGAYCIERELISWRRFSFPEGVAVGDLIAFPNTAGYLMHILESASHQMPLAKNLLVNGGNARLDPIDLP